MSRGEETSKYGSDFSVSPCTVRKRVAVIPSSRARRFMRSTIASHEPAACSASATAASFALWIISA